MACSPRCMLPSTSPKDHTAQADRSRISLGTFSRRGSPVVWLDPAPQICSILQIKVIRTILSNNGAMRPRVRGPNLVNTRSYWDYQHRSVITSSSRSNHSWVRHRTKIRPSRWVSLPTRLCLWARHSTDGLVWETGLKLTSNRNPEGYQTEHPVSQPQHQPPESHSAPFPLGSRQMPGPIFGQPPTGVPDVKSRFPGPGHEGPGVGGVPPFPHSYGPGQGHPGQR